MGAVVGAWLCHTCHGNVAGLILPMAPLPPFRWVLLLLVQLLAAPHRVWFAEPCEASGFWGSNGVQGFQSQKKNPPACALCVQHAFVTRLWDSANSHDTLHSTTVNRHTALATTLSTAKRPRGARAVWWLLLQLC